MKNNKEKFEKELMNSISGPNDRGEFIDMRNCFTGIEDMDMRARIERIRYNIRTSPKRFMSIEEYYGSVENFFKSFGGLKRLFKLIGKKHNNPEDTVDNENAQESYINESSLAIVKKIDSAIEKENKKKTKQKTKKQKQMDLDRDSVREFYLNPTPQAFKSLWERFRFGVHSHLSKIVGDWERAEDLVQETFIRAWEKRYMYNPNKSNFSTWLYTIARNLTFSQLKKESKDRTIDLDVNDVFSSALHPNGEGAANDEVYYVLNEDNNIVSNTFEELTKKMHDVSINEILTMDPLFGTICKLKNQDNLSLREIAETLNMTESKIKNCYYKNKEVLKEKLISKYHNLYVEYRDAYASHENDEDNGLLYQQ